MKLFGFINKTVKQTDLRSESLTKLHGCELTETKTVDRFSFLNTYSSSNYDIRSKQDFTKEEAFALDRNLVKEVLSSDLIYEYEPEDISTANVSSLSARYIMLGAISCNRKFFNHTIYPALLMAREYLYNFKYSTDGVSAYTVLKSRIARMVTAANKRTYLFNDFDEKSVLCAITFVLAVYSLGELCLCYNIKTKDGISYSPFVSTLEAFIKKTHGNALEVYKCNSLRVPEEIYSAGLIVAGSALSKLLLSIKEDKLKDALLPLKRKQVLHSLLCAVLSNKEGEPYFLEKVRPYFKDENGNEFLAPQNWYEIPRFIKAEAYFHEESLNRVNIQEYRNLEPYPSTLYDRKLLGGFKELYKIKEELNEQKMKAQKDYTELLRAQEQIRASFVKLQSQNIKARTPVKDYYSSYELLSIIDDYLKQENKQSVEEMFHPRSRVRSFLNKGSCTDFNRRLASIIRQRLNSILSFVREGNLSCDFNLKDAIYASVKNKWAISMIEKFIKEKTKEIEQLQD